MFFSGVVTVVITCPTAKALLQDPRPRQICVSDMQNEPKDVMPDLKRVLENVIRDRDPSMIRRMLKKQSPQDIASLLDRLETQDQVIVFRLLPRNTSATVFEYLNTHAQEILLKAMARAMWLRS